MENSTTPILLEITNTQRTEQAKHSPDNNSLK